MRTSRLVLTTGLLALLVSCAPPPKKAHAKSAAPPPASTPPPGPASTPPPGPAVAKPAVKLEPDTEIVEMLEKTHPMFLESLHGLGDRATSAAKAPARDPVRAEKFRDALDGDQVLAELTQKLRDDPTNGIAAVRTWLTSEEGKAFAAARKYEVEVHKNRKNLAGPSLERRNAARRLVSALGDGRLHGLTDFSVLTQAFLGANAPGKVAGDIHQRLIDQGPWLLERSGELGTAMENWTIASMESTTTFWESPAGKEYTSALDRTLTSVIEARIASVEGTSAAAATTPAPSPAP